LLLSDRKEPFKLTLFQDDFVFSNKRFPAFVAGVGTGKSMCLIFRMMYFMEKYPNNLGIIIRKEFTDLRDSTLKDFELYTGLKVGANKDVTLKNGSTILFRHGDEINVLKNINAGAIGLEQAEEFVSDEQFQFLRDRLRRKETTEHSLFLTANTCGHNWIWQLWKNNIPTDDYKLVEANTFDNADNLPKSFIDDRKRLLIESPHHYARYVMNSWEDLEEEDNLIPYEFINNSKNLGFMPMADGGIVVGVDIARFGDDETVFTAIQKCSPTHWKQIFQEHYNHRDLMQTAGRAKDLKAQFNAEYLVIDDDGLGGGVADRLTEQDIPVVRFKASEKAVRDGFWNKRIEQFWKLRELLRQGYLELYNDDELHQQLSSLKYKFKSNGLKVLESKDEAKKRGIKSPDRADALMMACSVVSLVPESDKILTKAESFWNTVRADRDILAERLKENDDSEFRTL